MMHTNTNPVPVTRQQSPVTPEIAEALKTLRAADFRLEQTYFPFGDWESHGSSWPRSCAASSTNCRPTSSPT
jgi:hypothetical protein